MPKRKHVLVAVACTILLTCAGLLFPAIQRVREAAARMSCYGRFKQLSVALHMYAANPEKFPPAAVAHPDLPPEQRLSWMVLVLPYVEEDRAFKQFDLARGPGDPRNEKPVRGRFGHFVCPSSGEHERGSGRITWDESSGERKHSDRAEKWASPAPLTHYVGVAGVGANAATLPLGHPRAGVFGYDRQTKLTKDGFPDGTSNTLLLIETARDPGHWAYGGFATVRGFESDAAPYLGEGRPFGGFHGNYWLGERRCVVALADGSVRSFTPKTDPAILEGLATVGGKEALPVEW